MVYQAIRNGKPDYLKELLTDYQPRTIVTLRRSDDPFMLDEPRCNLQMGFRAFKTSAPRLYKSPSERD